MADKEYEYRFVAETVPLRKKYKNKPTVTLWFRSTNYLTFSPYGWDTLSTTYPSSEENLLAAVKQLWNLADCEFIPVREGVPETMLTSG